MNQWQGENDFVLFKASAPISDKQIWQAFFHLHKERIQVKKEKTAIDKIKIIINATFKLSNQKGFSLMSLRDLSQETGMSMGSLYAYIGSKGQLAEMIQLFLPHIFDLCIGEQLALRESSKKQLTKLIRGHIFITEKLQPWFFFAFMESKNLNKEQRKYAIASELMVEQKIKNAIIEGQDLDIYNTILNAETIAAHIKPLLHDWYLKRWKYRQRNINIEDFCFSVMIFINQGLTKQS